MPIVAAARSRRHPHQVLIAVMCVLSGLPILFGGPRPGSLTAALPVVFLYVWAIVITTCGVLVVAAALVRSVINALYLEMIADLPLALILAAYAVALLSSAGLRGLVPATIVVGASAAFGMRWWQVHKTFGDVQASVTEGRS
jgi:hypothetical protein